MHLTTYLQRNRPYHHRREFLLQNFPEDQPEGLFANPVIVEDDKEEEV
jgi:hypothetical protein